MMPTDVLSILGARIREARNERNLTQERLAELAGLSTRHLAKIEKGAVNPSFEILSTLKKTLGVSVDAILDPSIEPVEAEIREIAGLCRACPEQERQMILAAIRAMAWELSKE